MPGQKIRAIVDCDGVADRIGLNLAHMALIKLGWLHADPTLSEESFVFIECRWETAPVSTEIHVYSGAYRNFNVRQDFTVEVTIRWTVAEGWHIGKVACVHANGGKVTFDATIDWSRGYPVCGLSDPVVWMKSSDSMAGECNG